MEPTILLGVDEFTVVLSAYPIDIRSLEEWPAKAESMIECVARLANFEKIFGKKNVLEDKLPQGYTEGYQFGDNPFYFAIAYHPSHPKMGVIVKFSARSWSVYCQKTGSNIKRFLHSIHSFADYSLRLSRVDFTVDYINWELSVDDIYQNLIQKKLEIRNAQDKKNTSQIKALERDGVASTFYTGSKKTGTRLFLRVYDKRKEQLEQQGIYYREALDSKSWVRFEAVFKGDYAHQLTKIIMETEEENLKDLIADKVTEKFRFYDLERKRYTDYTTALLEKCNKTFCRLRLESPRDNDLVSSLLHLINGSGLFPTLYKCDKIWGKDTSVTLLRYLHDIYINGYEPNEDVLLWIKKHKSTLEKQSLEDDLELIREARIRENEEPEMIPETN